jgi:murein L,D-transpeptidase YafK
VNSKLTSIWSSDLVKRQQLTLFVIALIIALAYVCELGSSQQINSMYAKQRQNPERTSLQLPIEKPRMVVYKRERKLEFYADQTLLRTYRVGLGFSPVADKKREGDGATPEGKFYVFVKNNRSAYYLSLGLSYPNVEDAERGLRDGLISKVQHNSIVEAIQKKAAPPQYTKLGGLIYIHGHGAGSDWTWGCVALENEDIKELYDAVSVGTPVTIFP